jgi:hypothetical protein
MRATITLTFAVLLLHPLCAHGGQDEPIVHHPPSGDTAADEGVAGRVTDASGNPVSGALVDAASLDDPSLPIPEVAIITDGKGLYVWRLAPGKYEISISAAGFHGAAKEVVVVPERQSKLNFTLDRVR